ncbi:hypothetical protein HG530_004743 [Fusarium avenaceum]|nr:hypothetical protein HG530_004743 [Fusarium avenaceum]
MGDNLDDECVIGLGSTKVSPEDVALGCITFDSSESSLSQGPSSVMAANRSLKMEMATCWSLSSDEGRKTRPIPEFHFPLHPSSWFACSIFLSSLCIQHLAFPLFFGVFLVTAIALLIIKPSYGVPFSCFPNEPKLEGRQAKESACNSLDRINVEGVRDLGRFLLAVLKMETNSD